MIRRPPRSTLFPSPTLSQSRQGEPRPPRLPPRRRLGVHHHGKTAPGAGTRVEVHGRQVRDRKSTRLNSSHGYISYAVFCLKKKKKPNQSTDKCHPTL